MLCVPIELGYIPVIIELLAGAQTGYVAYIFSKTKLSSANDSRFGSEISSLPYVGKKYCD
jgi:hypothetical protein